MQDTRFKMLRQLRGYNNNNNNYEDKQQQQQKIRVQKYETRHFPNEAGNEEDAQQMLCGISINGNQALTIA